MNKINLGFVFGALMTGSDWITEAASDVLQVAWDMRHANSGSLEW